MSAFSKCQHDCWGDKENHCITLALFCQHDFSATSKVQNYQNKTGEKFLYPNIYVLTTYFKEI